MSFNNARERRKFMREQERFNAEYDKHHMSEDAKSSMYDFDLKVFHNNRVYAEHNVPLPETEYTDELGYSSLLREHGDAFITPSFEETLDQFDWLDTIENEALYKKLRALTDADLELIRLVFLDGCTQKEAAKKMSLSESKVSRRMKKILKALGDVQF